MEYTFEGGTLIPITHADSTLTVRKVTDGTGTINANHASDIAHLIIDAGTVNLSGSDTAYTFESITIGQNSKLSLNGVGIVLGGTPDILMKSGSTFEMLNCRAYGADTPISANITVDAAGAGVTISGSLYGNATNLGGTITGEGELLVTNGSSGSNNFTISSVISDKDASHQMSVKVNKNSSVVVFSGNNTYTGGTTIVQGTLQTNSATALGQGSVLVQGGTLNANSQALANAITLQTGTIQNLGSASAPKDLTVSLTGNAAINNSTVILGNASGAPMISTGQVLTLSGTTSATLNNATLNLSSFNTALIDMQGTSTLNLTGGLTLNLDSALALDLTSLTIDLITVGEGTSLADNIDWDSLLTLTQNGQNLIWDGVTYNNGSLTFTGIVDGVRVTRVISFNADNYLLSENILVGSADQAPRTVRLGFTVAATPFSNGKYDPTRLAWDANESFKEETSASTLAEKGIIEQGVFNWAGVMSNYFMNVTAPADPNNLTLKGRVQGDVWRLALERPDLLTPSNGGEVPVAVNWWFGPKDRTMLATAPDHLSQAVNFGMFSIIARPLLTILAFFHSFVGNWGIAILMLTFCIRVVFWPLSQKSFKSMEQMKKLQPMMKKLREKHKDDKEALNKEMMQLYKTYKVNPAGGCLPIVVQIPVFIGLYQALLNSIELRHASFIEYLPFTHITWLADLSAADPFYITPLLMGASMFLQQRLTPAAGDPTQQKVMMFMPVIFTVMFINFPAGLVIYWLCNNILSIGQQWWMLRKA